MSNYKVGDLASLFPTPPAKDSGNDLQTLFNKHWNKKKSAYSPSENTKSKRKFEKSDSEAISPSGKKLKKYVPKELIIDGQLSKKPIKNEIVETSFARTKKNKKQKKVKLENSSFNNNPIEATENVDSSEAIKVSSNKNNGPQGFIRCSKNKRKEKSKKNVINSEMSSDGKESDELFSVSNEGEIQNKKLKKLNKKKNVPKSKKNSVETTLDFIPLNSKKQNFPNGDKKESEEVNAEAKRENKVDLNKDLDCTLFVGNLPMSADRKVLQKLFHPFGPLKTVRFRGAVPTKIGIPKKVAEITNKYHEGVHSLKGFVVFKDRESAKSALSLNGTLFDNRHIVVDFATAAGGKKMYDDNLSVFIGNLPFDVDDETVRSEFEDCGEIRAVRVIRDKNSGVGKGFGYIQFQDIEARKKALTMTDVEISGRKIRIKPVESKSQSQKGSKESLMMIRSNVAMKRSKESGGKKSVKKLLKKGRRLHQKKRIARLFGEKFVK